jgi:UDP-N-acetylmuramyl tripeptide synthase
VSLVRAMLALWAARLAAAISRLVGRGGSSLPGAVARRLDPNVLRKMGGRLSGGALLITGTNGKTTSALLLEQILTADGRRVVRNRSGANLIEGLTATLLASAGLGLRMRADWAVLETDEASIPRAVSELGPDLLAVTNFFRDQLDRYGELSTTVSMVDKGVGQLPDTAVLVVNADDPYAAKLARSAPGRVVYFGLDADVFAGEGGEETLDARFCPVCGGTLQYRIRFYAHLGHWRCPECGFRRPDPSVAAVGGAGDGVSGRTLALCVDGRPLEVTLALPGTYNLYNAVLAVAVAHTVGASDDAIQGGLHESRGAFGRMETVIWQGRELRLALVKNPTGFNQVLRAVAEDPRPKTVMVAINDRYADGRDVSWLWDVDLETLAPRLGAASWVAAGVRARDMAVRLKYAGVRSEEVRTAGPTVDDALRTLAEVTEPRLCYVLPTYTAMMELRGALQRQGLVASFVEG